MKKLFLLVAFVLNSQFSHAEETREFACGTNLIGGSFYSDFGTLKCADKDAIEVSVKNDKIFCFYNATCMPVFSDFKDYASKQYAGKAYKELSDKEINRVIVNGLLQQNFPFLKRLSQTGIQCLGEKSDDGTPNCPNVNDCMNAKVSGKFMKMSVLKLPDLTVAPADNSTGFKTSGPKTIQQ